MKQIRLELDQIWRNSQTVPHIDTDDFSDRKPYSLTGLPHNQETGKSVMNMFDALVYAGLIIAAITGFNTGLLRSAVTILAYLFALPITLWAISLLALQIDGKPDSPLAQNWVIFFGAFMAIGILLGKVARMALDEVIGPEVGIADRLSGAALGALRVGLVATTLVLIFDRLVPGDRQPAFLAGSHLRPLFSAAGQKGLRSLPPDVALLIDRLKQERRI
jgi:membrane protein required for colicin V production